MGCEFFCTPSLSYREYVFRSCIFVVCSVMLSSIADQTQFIPGHVCDFSVFLRATGTNPIEPTLGAEFPVTSEIRTFYSLGADLFFCLLKLNYLKTSMTQSDVI